MAVMPTMDSEDKTPQAAGTEDLLTISTEQVVEMVAEVETEAPAETAATPRSTIKT